MNIKKILSIILTIVLTMGMGTVTFANAENLETIPEIKEDYIPIYTAEDLNNIRNNLSGKYILMNDIDMSAYENWEPIGNASNPFAGIFDGNSFTVKNLRITKAEGENPSVGLFGTVRNSQIKNITVVGIINVHNDNGIRAGLICGEAYYSAISNCITFGEIVASTNAGAWVGGVVGFLSVDEDTYKECTIKQCKNNATITVNGICNYKVYGINYFTGGIAGASNGTISGCSNYGNVSAYGKNGYYEYFFTLAGGICGNSNGELTNCYNIGDVSSAGEKYAVAGGVSGHWYQFGDIRNCYNAGQVKAETINYSGEYEHSFVGGIIGAIEGWVVPAVIDGGDYECKAGVYNCYYLNNVEDAFGDGLPVNQENVKSLTKEEMASQASFVGFDFDNIWKMSDEIKMPVLICEIETTNRDEITTELVDCIEFGMSDDMYSDLPVDITDIKMYIKINDTIVDSTADIKMASTFRIGFINFRVILNGDSINIYIGNFIKIDITKMLGLSSEGFEGLMDTEMTNYYRMSDCIVYKELLTETINIYGYENANVAIVEADVVQSALNAEKNGAVFLPEGVTFEGKTEKEIIAILEANSKENEQLLEMLTTQTNIYYVDDTILNIITVSNGEIVANYRENGINYIKPCFDESIFDAPKFSLDLTPIAKLIFSFMFG